MNSISAQFCITENGFGMTDINRINIKPRTVPQVVVHFTNGYAMVVSLDSEFHGPEGRILVREFNDTEPFYNMVLAIQKKFNRTKKRKFRARASCYKLGIYMSRGLRAVDFLYDLNIPDKCKPNIKLPMFDDGRIKVYCPRSAKKYANKIKTGERVLNLNWAEWTKKDLQDYVTGYLDFKVKEEKDYFVIYYNRFEALSQIWAMLAALGIPAEIKVYRFTKSYAKHLYSELIIPKSKALYSLPDFIYLTEESESWPDIKINTDEYVYYKNTYKFIFQTKLEKFIYDTPTPPYERNN